MICWHYGDEITHTLLNQMQERPNMEASSKKGLATGGLSESDLSEAAIEEYDPAACMLSNPKQVIIEDHRVGQLKYEYRDDGSQIGWNLRGGRPGLTGMRQVAPGNLQWLCKNDLPNDAKKYVWQKITTDEYGNPTSVSQCIKTQSIMSSSSWDPVTCTPGIIWRRLASIEPDTSVDPHPSCKHSWGMKAINENNLYVMPMARRYGVINSEDIFIDQGSDLKDRGSSSHWTPAMYGEVGLSNLIQSVGELGGTFVYQTKAACGTCRDYGVGIASGVEFYDNTTYKECYNSKQMRPKSTSACVSLGYGGSIRIENVNKKHPWQFKISATPIKVTGGTLACGLPCYWDSNEYLLQWGTTPPYSYVFNGPVSGEMRRITGGFICESDLGENHQDLQSAIGEIRCGKIGIRTATWRDPGSGVSPSQASTFKWNRQGGVVTGIVEDLGADSELRPYIDINGMIHVRSRECNDSGKGQYHPGSGSGGNYVRTGTKTTAPLTNSGAGGFVWRSADAIPKVNEGRRCIGVLNGDVERLLGNKNCYDAISFPQHFRAGEIIDGKIGIGTAHYMWIDEYHEDQPHSGSVCANSSGGLIVGIKNDSPCRWGIENGMIHVPNPEWMGKYGVMMPCASAKLTNYLYGQSAYPHYLWPILDKKEWCHSTPYTDGGKVTGEIAVLKNVIGGKADTPQIYPCNGHHYMWPEMGEVLCGTIGIPTAYFQAFKEIEGNETPWIKDWQQNALAQDTADSRSICYKWAPGVLRGVMADILWDTMYFKSDGTATYPPEGEIWPYDDLPSCVDHLEFFPLCEPNIDQNGILHLPHFFFSADKDEYCGRTRLVNFAPNMLPDFMYQDPEEPPPPTPDPE